MSGRLALACALFACCARTEAPTPIARARPATATFTCAADRCVQRPARLPDDGEWTCVDSAGVVVCVGGEPAAGVVAGPPDPAWRCNARVAAAHDDLGARICVDGAPDFPDADRARWRCRIENGPSPKRVCEHATAASIWNPCDRAHPCVDGATCTDAHCVVPSTTPSCWLDTDCPSHACRFGTCRPEGAP